MISVSCLSCPRGEGEGEGGYFWKSSEITYKGHILPTTLCPRRADGRGVSVCVCGGGGGGRCAHLGQFNNDLGLFSPLVYLPSPSFSPLQRKLPHQKDRLRDPPPDNGLLKGVTNSVTTSTPSSVIIIFTKARLVLSALFMLRDPSFLDTVPEEHKKLFIDGATVAPAKLKVLKDMIKKRFPVSLLIG